MTTVLLTGFEPFGGEALNPSWEAVRRLDGLQLEELQLVAVQLPCVFGAALTRLQQALAQHQPALVLAVGQAGGRAELSLERVAINIDDARIPDNAGAQPIDEPVIAAAPAAYFTTLPIKAMVAALRAAGIPAAVSHSAGTYVCNHVFFGLMHAASSNPALRQAGFMHIPYLPEQAAQHAPGTASLALTQIIDGIKIALLSAHRTTQDLRQSGGSTH
uniref:Pyroglutamyl-peptidase I n=1 Tax=Hucho hucho TaxID=62062 RepID=A0A4W5LSG6_9TELE